MVFLKEDGSLDIDKIDKLPIKEYVKVIEDMTMEQYKEYTSKADMTLEQYEEYISKLPLDERKERLKKDEFYSLQELIEEGRAVNLREYLNNWEKENKKENKNP